ncbi:MAG: linear amide C-N hydrolase [Candidatus Eisenbacteria bacterium]
MNAARLLIRGAVLAVILSAPAFPCTTFVMEGPEGPVVGKNYDWTADAGQVLVNPRGLEKRAGGAGSHAWTARYGSVTFNQYGRERPSGGINEAGLVIEVMWLEEAEYPEEDGRAALSPLAWIQYNLDVSATVNEVIASDRVVRIGQGGAPLHFLAADRSGAAATIEFLEGRMVAHTGKDLPWPVLTNDTYDRSLARLGEAPKAVGPEAFPGPGSLERFCRASLRSGEGGGPQEAFGILDDCAMEEYNAWRIVYDVAGGTIRFRTRSAPQVRSINLSRIDFDCSAPVLMVDMGGSEQGDVTDKLVPWTAEANYALMKRSFAETSFTKDVPDSTIRRLAERPAALQCAE